MNFIQRTILLVALMVMIGLPLLPQASAQRSAACTVYRELITTLRPPSYGVPSVWTGNYARPDYRVAFHSGVTLEPGVVLGYGVQEYQPVEKTDQEDEAAAVDEAEEDIAAEKSDGAASADADGEKTVAGHDEGVSAQRELVLARLNRRGRVLDEYKYDAPDDAVPVKFIKLQDGHFLGITNHGNVEYGDKKNDSKSRQSAAENEESGTPPVKPVDRYAMLHWFDDDGGIVDEVNLSHDDFHYTAQDIVQRADGGFVVALQAHSKEQADENHTVLMSLDADAKEEWRRAYRVGIPNKINAVQETTKGNIVAAGQIETDAGMKAGWVMKVSAKGSILWQRTYRKGLYGSFNDIVDYSPPGAVFPHFVLTGVVDPTDKSARANWVVAVSSLGDPEWERYFRVPSYALSGLRINRYDDGRIVLFGRADYAGGKTGYDHVRMLVLSPNGLLMQDESYLSGDGATIHDAILGWRGERVVFGTAYVDTSSRGRDKNAIQVIGIGEEDEKPQSLNDRVSALLGMNFGRKASKEGGAPPETMNYEGWVLVGTALDPYENPCVPQQAQ
ncbi:MAG: hypothetical protein QF692_07345 [Alphaproteobacteria bacterium]|jgi:hypothetical protein|nr:hypothetical protein [Alphaproteobacteria bacterium]MDP7223062.1 hypothetical protein [Alphaproteobacteria bacterium]